MISEDRSVLSAMVEDMEAADPLYRPGNYWQVYFNRFYPTLLRDGLARFRASGDRTYRSMGVSGKPFLLQKELRSYWFREQPALKRIVLSTFDRLGIFSRINTLTTDLLQQTFTAFQLAYFQLALETDPDREILRVSDSGEGAPMDYFHPDAHEELGYTISFLRCFREHQWAKRFIDFNGIRGVLEIGGGYGAQAEVLLKLYNGVGRYVLCDIPPQLYIQQCYLDAVFPGQVTGYAETRQMKEVDLAATKRIVIIAPWQLQKVAGSFDLFWNSASFQEMEPDIVENYANIISRLVKGYIYLKEDPTGRKVAERKGQVGVLEPILLDSYQRYFSDYELVCTEDCVHVTCTNPHAAPLLSTTLYDQMLFRSRLLSAR